MHPDMPYIIILLCLTPDNLLIEGNQGESGQIPNCVTNGVPIVR